VEKLDELSAVIKENQEKIRGQIVALDELWKSQLDEVFSNEEWENNTIEYISLGIQY
jgi:small nuclear ribonucleoprotein (snRNP)-like protein